MPPCASVAGFKQTQPPRQPCVSRVCRSASFKIDFIRLQIFMVLILVCGGGGVQLFLEMASRCHSYCLILKFLEHFFNGPNLFSSRITLGPKFIYASFWENHTFLILETYLFICVCMRIYTHACYVHILWCACRNWFFPSCRFQG